jgi:SAM-dependent methyltransferase
MSSAARLAADWAERVRANRDQVERFREVPDGADFYAPVSRLFVEDPERTGDAVLDVLLSIARPGETWLDIGAGAGRYALPLARVVGEVVAVEPSRSMTDALRAGMAEHGIHNVRIVGATWPMPPEAAPSADVALIAQVGYDIDAIGPFLDGMEVAAQRRCVAVLMDRSPSSFADPFWTAVHGEARRPLPAMPDLVALLRARGREPSVRSVPRPRRAWESEETLLVSLRHQLWIAEDGPADRRLREVLPRHVRRDADGGLTLDSGPTEVSIAEWALPAGDP